MAEEESGVRVLQKTTTRKQKSLALQSWLGDGGSFIQRLKKQGLQPHVVVLNENWGSPEPAEQAALELSPRRHAYIREVEIRDKREPLMFARTVIPAGTLTGRERILASLGSRSLGSVLFSYPDLERSPFEIKTCHLPQYASSELWERQSLFIVHGKLLLLREVYLPHLVRFIESL